MTSEKSRSRRAARGLGGGQRRTTLMSSPSVVAASSRRIFATLDYLDGVFMATRTKPRGGADDELAALDWFRELINGYLP